MRPAVVQQQLGWWQVIVKQSNHTGRYGLVLLHPGTVEGACTYLSCSCCRRGTDS
jgi:hypothetical protein